MRKRAKYGSLLENKKRFCGKHKREGDVDLTQKMCEKCLAQKPPVEKQASYGSALENKKRFCSGHQREGDEDLSLTSIVKFTCYSKLHNKPNQN